MLSSIGDRAARLSAWLDLTVQHVCVALAVLLVLDVWLGVVVRYALPLPITFMEEVARYLMIWMALLAVSSGIAHREHIGVEFVFSRMPGRVRRWLAVSFDVIGFLFFFALFWYGLTFSEKGFSRLSMIYAMPKGYAFAGVPLAAFVACIQMALVGIHDYFAERAPRSTGQTSADGSLD